MTRGSEQRGPARQPPSLPFDRVAHLYDETRGGDERGRRYAAELNPLLDTREAALEIGVGTGVVAKGLTDLGHRVVGVDVSPPMLTAAARRIGPRVVAGDATRLPFRGGAFVQAYTVWVLHVVGDQTGLLREAGRVLGRDGRLVAVPALGPRPADPLGAVVWDMQRRLDPDGHRRDDPERLAALAPAAGLRVVQVRGLETAGYEESPAEVVFKLEHRTFSCLWDLRPGQWEEVVEPVIEAVRAMAHPDRPIPRYPDGSLVVFARAAD